MPQVTVPMADAYDGYLPGEIKVRLQPQDVPKFGRIFAGMQAQNPSIREHADVFVSLVQMAEAETPAVDAPIPDPQPPAPGVQ